MSDPMPPVPVDHADLWRDFRRAWTVQQFESVALRALHRLDGHKTLAEWRSRQDKPGKQAPP